MRKVIVCNIVSLDGFYTGPNDNVMVMPMDGAFDTYNAERLGTADTLLLGRKSYDLFRGFWPAVVDNPDATVAEREVSRRNNAIDKVVVSDSLTADRTAPWQDNTTIVSRAEAHKQIADLKGQPGKDILIFGSHQLWTDLLAHGLVDELHLIVGSVVLGAGTPAFEADPGVSLQLIDVGKMKESNNFLVRYQVSVA